MHPFARIFEFLGNGVFGKFLAHCLVVEGKLPKTRLLRN